FASPEELAAQGSGKRNAALDLRVGRRVRRLLKGGVVHPRHRGLGVVKRTLDSDAVTNAVRRVLKERLCGETLLVEHVLPPERDREGGDLGLGHHEGKVVEDRSGRYDPRLR